jgi:alcohol dehydrogenase class IV
MAARDPGNPALGKYANIGRLLSQQHLSDPEAHQALIDTLETWTQQLELPRLAAYRVTAADIPRIVANSRGSSMKTNPIELNDQDISDILIARL